MTSKIEVNREWLADLQTFFEEAFDGGIDGILQEECGIQIEHVRALLAAQEAPRQDIQQMASMPVERCYDVRVKMIIAFNESRKNGGDLDDGLDAAYKAALRYSPAPLSPDHSGGAGAVVLPPKEVIRLYMSVDELYHAQGFNECLSRVKELNQ